MTLDIALGIIQIILGIKFVSVAYTHGLRQGQPTMAEAVQKMGQWSRPVLYLTVVGTLIGSLGLILPAVLGLWTWLTPVMAIVLAIMILASIIFHVNCRQEPKIFASIILFALTAFVAYRRWALAPL